MAKRRDSKRRALLKGETQRKDGRYQYSYVNAAGKRKTVYSWRLLPTDPVPEGCRKCKSLRELEREVQKDIMDGIVGSGNLTVNDLFDRLMILKTPTLKPTTKKDYEIQFNRWVRDGFGQLHIQGLKRSDVMTYLTDLLQDQDLSGGTVKRINCMINQAFQLAVQDDLIRKNPCDGVIAELGRTGALAPKKKTALTAEQQQNFLDFVHNSVFAYWYPLFVFLFGTGARIGEAAGLIWKDVDLNASEANIRQSVGITGDGEVYTLLPKTAAGVRCIPLLPEVKTVLAALPDQRPMHYVFLNQAGHKLDIKKELLAEFESATSSLPMTRSYRLSYSSMMAFEKHLYKISHFIIYFNNYFL